MTALSILDASAYRRLVRDLDQAGARDVALALAAAERAHGGRAVASPFTLWALLADVAAVVKPANEKRGPTDVEHARSARARLAVLACLAHTARDRGEPGAHPFVLAEDPDTRLCRTVGVAVPPGLAAWNEYLASLAVDVATEPTDATARRLAGPLAHVLERAGQSAEDYADEMQDAVLAAYESGAAAWDDTVTDADRQDALTAPGALLAADDDDETLPADADALMAALVRRDPLLRAVALRRAERAHRFAARDASEPVVESYATVGEATRVAEAFPAGVAVGRELLRRVIAGEVEVAGRAARRWLWDLHVAYGLAAGEGGVTGSETVGEALGTTPGVETLDAYRRRVGA